MRFAWSPWIAVLVLVSAPARGYLPPERCPGPLLTTIPAGGWVPLWKVEQDVVATSRGVPLLGKVVTVAGHRYWRPEEPLATGTELLVEHESCGGVAATTLVRVEGRLFESQFDFLPSVSAGLDRANPTRVLRCGADEQSLAEAGFCDCELCDCELCDCEPLPEPLDVAVELPEVWQASAYFVDPSAAARGGQVLLRVRHWFGEELSDAPWTMAYESWSRRTGGALPVGAHLCSTAEVLLVPTAERWEVTRCVDVPEDELTTLSVAPYFSGPLASCTLPPAELPAEDLPSWCAAFDHCAERQLSERERALCTNHYELCGTSPLDRPERPAAASGGAGGRVVRANDGEPKTNPLSCTSAASSSGSPQSGLAAGAAVFAAFTLLRRRRTARGAAPATS